MPTFAPGRIPAALALALALALAACGGSGGDGGPDGRCFGVAQVPGWQIHLTSGFTDTGSVDSFTVALHSTVDGTASTGPVQPSVTNPNGFSWFGGKPTGTITAKDTVIVAHKSGPDTIVGTAVGFAPGPNSRTGPYLSVDLASCKATVGALVYASVTEVQSGQPTITDTIFAAYPFQPGLTIDSLFVANGFTISAAKVPSVLPDAPFGATAEYRVGGLSAVYANDSTPGFDSATVAWTVTPLAAAVAPPMHGSAAGSVILPSGAVVPPRR